MLLKTTKVSADAEIIVKRLRSELIWITCSGFAGLLLGASTLILLTTPVQALIWLSAGSLCFALVSQQIWKRLTLNRPGPGSPLYPDMGWANRMTIGRGWLIAATGGFLFIPAALQQHSILIWIAAALYSAAAIFDRADGFIARKTRRSSLLGAELDTVFDALGLLVAPLLALQLGKIHASYLLVSVAYYFFVLGIRFRERHDRPVYPLAPSKLRRTLAGFQMAYVAVVLWPPFQAQVTVTAGFGFMLPLLAGFLVDWCVVSGRINPYEPVTCRVFLRLNGWLNTVLLPVVRLALVPGLIYIASHSQWATTSEIIAGFLVLMITTGLAGRTGAMLLLMLMAWTAPLPIFEPAMLCVVSGAIVIVLFGCGRFCLWQADDDWVNRQDGA